MLQAVNCWKIRIAIASSRKTTQPKMQTRQPPNQSIGPLPGRSDCRPSARSMVATCAMPVPFSAFDLYVAEVCWRAICEAARASHLPGNLGILERPHKPAAGKSRSRCKHVGIAPRLREILACTTLRNKDSASLKATAVQIVHRVVHRRQRVGLGVQLYLALGGEGHQLGEVVEGADQVADDVPLGGDDVDGVDVDGPAVADHEMRLGPLGHRPGVVLGAALA